MAAGESQYEDVALEAEQVIREHNIIALPVDPFSIAATVGIDVQPKPSIAAGVSGMLCKAGDNFGILYATHVPNEGFQRFNVSHELGHYFLPGHIDHLFDEGQTVHQSQSGFVSANPYELEADHFAASLLMPRILFTQATLTAGEGLAAVEFLADLCRTSLTATAIRYTQCTEQTVAVIMSTGNRIDYCFMSTAFKEIRGFQWLRKNSPVPSLTLTHALGRDPSRVARVDRLEGETNLSDWFGGYKNVKLNEEAVGLGRYGKVLTVLYTDGLEAKEEDEDGELEELNGELSWPARKRRR